MRHTFPQLFLLTVILMLAVVSFSCNKSNPVALGTPQLTASENPVTVAIHWAKYLTISGGQGPCTVKSISDSSIITAAMDPFTSPTGRSLSLSGKAIGTVKVVVQDSAKTAEVEVLVTVATMAASPSNVTVQVQRTQYVSIQGGTYPYTLDQQANSSVASVNLSSSSLYVDGVAAGSTSVVVKDNASPPNKVTIAITVVPKPALTTAGTISLTSSIGKISANGILTNDLDKLPSLPSNSEGAGGSISLSSYGPSFTVIIGYQKKSQNTADIVEILLVRSSLSPGVVPIDSSRILWGADTAIVFFAYAADLTSNNIDAYIMHGGTLTVTALSAQRAAGTFSGTANMIRGNSPVAGTNIAVSSGAFDVPLLEENSGPTIQSPEQLRIMKFMERTVGLNLRKMK